MRPKHLVTIIFILMALAAPASPGHAGSIVSVCDKAHLLTALSGDGAVAVTETVTVPDDELVLINRDARIVVKDPYTPPGNQQLYWESPQTGFGQVATGDFNGDGTAEIVGLRGGEAYVFDPYRQPGESGRCYHLHGHARRSSLAERGNGPLFRRQPRRPGPGPEPRSRHH